MHANFWHQRWETNQIGFHNTEAHPLFVRFFNELSLVRGNRVFLPLCGKTKDISWLLSNDFKVAGSELNEIAVEQLFAELGVEPEISNHDELKLYRAKNIDIFVGDIFTLTKEALGSVNAVYDRAALVALPEAMRFQYTEHVIKLVDNAPQLLISFEYDKKQMDVPPFSISLAEVGHHYTDSYELSLLTSESVIGGLKGKCEASENVWLLGTKAYE